MKINNLKFNKKLILLQILPMIGMFLFAAYGIFGKMSDYSDMQKVKELSHFTTKLSSFVHEMQKERGATAVYVGSQGKKYGREVDAQRINTNEKREVFHTFLKEFNATEYGFSFESKLNDTLGDIARLDNIRQQSTTLKISGAKAISYFTKTNGKMLYLIGEISGLSKDSTISGMNNGYVNLLKGKERVGIERAVLSNAFAANKISGKAYDKFKALNTEQTVFFDNFLQFATKSQVAFFHEKLSLPVVSELQKMKEVVYEKKTAGNFQVEASYWFETATSRINDLKEVEDAISFDLVNIAGQGTEKARNILTTFVLTMIVIMVLSLFLATIIGRSIIGSINQLRLVMAGVDEQSDLTLRVDVTGNDEIAQMGVAFNKMLQKFSALIEGIRSSSHQLNVSSSEMMERSDESTKAIVQQLLEIDKIVIAAEQLSSSAKEVALNSNEASQETAKADGQADDGSRLVIGATNSINILVSELETTTKIINELEIGANEIGSVLDVIRSIADQTNLLALNAAIEAARAGEHGRGFAVVADEVRNLASRTQVSTEEIQVMIEKLQQGSSSAVSAVEKGGEKAQESAELSNKAVESIGDISSAVSDISKMNNQIASTAQQQNKVVEEISQQIESVSSISNQTSEDAQKTAESSAQLVNLARELEKEVNEFKV